MVIAAKSVGYSGFRPVFWKVATDNAMLYIADLSVNPFSVIAFSGLENRGSKN